MTFLVYNSQKSAEYSLAAVNIAYGCPHRAENGYRMDQWDILAPSNDGNNWGFVKPVSRLGKTEEDLFSSLHPSFTEHEEKPDHFYPTDTLTADFEM